MEFQAQSDQSPPPSSQVVKHIFVDAAHQPLKIFLEPSEVSNRPKLVRLLKNGGGFLCEAVAEADFVVVAPETVSATQLIDSWLGEKIFLNVDWVYESIKKGRALLEEDNWGGFLAANSNVPVTRTHLPTPRETPSEQQTLAEESAMQNQPYSIPNPAFVQSGSPAPLGSQYQPQPIPQQPMLSQPLPMLQACPNGQVMIPAQLLMGLLQSQGINPANMVPVAQAPNQLPMNVVQGQPMPSNYTQQPMPPFMPQSAMFVQNSYMSPQGPSFPQHMVNMSFPQPMDISSPLHSGLSHNSATPESYAQGSGSMSETPSAMEQDEPPSRKKKSKAKESPVVGSSKKKVKTEGGRHSKYRRRSESYDEPPLPYPPSSSSPPRRHDASKQDGGLFCKRHGDSYQFFVQIGIRNRRDVVDSVKKQGGKVVSDIIDADFVILGHPTTQHFEDWLRQAYYFGKRPVKPQWVLDSVKQEEILDLDDYVYENFTVERKRGRPSSTGQRYIVTQVQSGSEDDAEQDEDEAEEEEDEDEEHEAEDLKVRKKAEKVTTLGKPVKKEKRVKTDKKADKKRADKKAETMLEKRKLEKNARKATVVEDEEALPASRKGKMSASARSPSPRNHHEPSPPPPTRVVQHTTGKNLYTKEDDDYCEKYIPILLARDLEMTTAAIAQKLHTKMPHHTASSWVSHLTHATRRAKLTEWRRRAGIQSRKTNAGGRRSTSATTGPVEPQPQTSEANPPAPPLPAIDPIKVMTQFFADGKADNLDDKEVWRVISQEHPQLTAAQWEAVWVQHNETISRKVGQITRASEESAQPSGSSQSTKPERE